MNEIPDGVPEDLDRERPSGPLPPGTMPFDPSVVVEAADEDFAAVAAACRKARDALVVAGFPPELLEAPSVEWAAQQAWQRACSRTYPAPASGWFTAAPPQAASFLSPQADKLTAALLKDATDEEILAIARAAREQLKEQDDANKWKRGES